MDYFPLFARLEGLPCLVVGAGNVAARKAKQLLRAGAKVSINAPRIGDELLSLANTGAVDVIGGEFSTELVANFWLVIAATDDADLNKSIALATTASGRFCNVVDDREASTAIIPAVIDRSPLMVAVSSGGDSPVLATRVKQDIERQLPAATGTLARYLGAHRAEVKSTLTTLDERRHFWQALLDSRLPELLMANDSARADSLFRKMLHERVNARGIALLVGAGPGDPDLLTLKAARALGSADVILHDRLIAPAILDMARKDAEFIPVGKQAGRQAITQERINELLIARVKGGNRVCRLKGGDPFIFGRGGEELAALNAAGLPWEVIPGITAASACAAATGIPLTHRAMARSVVFATGHTVDDSDVDWINSTHEEQTVVCYMAIQNLSDICSRMLAAGRAATCPAAMIENGATSAQRVLRGTLGDLAERVEAADIAGPALLIIGDVVGLDHIADATSLTAATNAEIWSDTASSDQLVSRGSR